MIEKVQRIKPPVDLAQGDLSSDKLAEEHLSERMTASASAPSIELPPCEQLSSEHLLKRYSINKKYVEASSLNSPPSPKEVAQYNLKVKIEK